MIAAVVAILSPCRSWRFTSASSTSGTPGCSTHLETELAERRKAEEALRASEGFYHSLVESLPAAILRKDLEGRFTFGNQKFYAALEVDQLDQLVGKTDLDFFPEPLAEKYRARRPPGDRDRQRLRDRRGARHAARREALRPGHQDAAARRRRARSSACRGSSGTSPSGSGPRSSSSRRTSGSRRWPSPNARRTRR